MKVSIRILSLVSLVLCAVSLIMSVSAAEGLLIAPNPLAAIDCQVFYADELMPIVGTKSVNAAQVTDGEKELVRITTTGIKDATGSYVIFNFYPQDKPENDFVPEFRIKDYPYVVVAYKTDIITTNSKLAINAGMRATEFNAYERFWGLTAPLKSDNKYHKAIYDLTTVTSFDGGNADWDGIDPESGIKYIRIPVWAYSKDLAMVSDEYFDIEYVGFFKTMADAEKYEGYDNAEDVFCNVTFKRQDGLVISTQKVLQGANTTAPKAPNVKKMVFAGWKTTDGEIMSDRFVVNSDIEVIATYVDDPNAADIAEIIDNSEFHGFTAEKLAKEVGSEIFVFDKDFKVIKENGHTFVRFSPSEDGKTTNGNTTYAKLNTGAYFMADDYPYMAVSYRSNIKTSSVATASVGLKVNESYSRFWGLKMPFIGDDAIHKAVVCIKDVTGGDVGLTYDYVDSDSTVSYVRLSPWEGGNTSVSSTSQYYDLEYVAFFKTKEAAEKFEYTEGAFDVKADGMHKPFISGYDGRLFKPENNMTRAEACTVVARLLVDENTLNNSMPTAFCDIDPSQWHYKYITYLESLGYLKSYIPALTEWIEFKPDQKITRAEFVELVYNMGKVSGGDKDISFKDVPASHPRYEVIMAAAKAGLVNGKTADTFDPDGDIKRSEVVKVLCIALGRTPSLAGMEKEIIVGFNDITEAHWAYPYVIESAYEHGYLLDTNGNEAWVDVVDNNVYLTEVPEGLVDELNAEFARRVEAIRATESEWELASKYNRPIYVSFSDGDDKNDGLTPETPIKTLAEVKRRSADNYQSMGVIRAGDVVLLKRGDEWHEKFSGKVGVTYSAYGEGEKPRILGSVEADRADQWIETDAPGVYKFVDTLTNTEDVGNIVFNNGYAFGQRLIKNPAGNRVLQAGRDYIVSNGLAKWEFKATDHKFEGYKDLKTIADKIPEADLVFYHDREGYVLYLYSRNGNPGDIFDSIEICVKGNAFNAASNMVIDNLFIGYTGSHGIGAGSTKNLTVRNCEIGWIGGSVQSEDVNTRFGNAIEIYGQADGYYVYNNYIYQCFDCGPTVQVGVTLTPGKQVYQKNIEFYDNVCWDADLEIWLTSTPANTETTFAKLVDCKLYNNYVTMSGYGWSAYNHQKNEYCAFYGAGETGAEHINCYIQDNYFWNLRYQLWKAVPTSMKDNLGFKWVNNVVIHREGALLGALGADTKTATGGLTSYTYNSETIKKLMADKCLGDNYYYALPSIGSTIPKEPLLPKPPIEEPFR